MRDGKWTPCCFTRFQARLGTIQSTKFAGIKWKRMLSKRMNRYLTGFVRLTSFLGLLNWIMLSFKLFRGPAMQNRPFIRQCLILAKWSKVLLRVAINFLVKLLREFGPTLFNLKNPSPSSWWFVFVPTTCLRDCEAKTWWEVIFWALLRFLGLTHRYPASHRTTND